MCNSLNILLRQMFLLLQLLDSLEDLHYECKNSTEKVSCVEKYKVKFEKAKELDMSTTDSAFNKHEELVKTFKQDIVSK